MPRDEQHHALVSGRVKIRVIDPGRITVLPAPNMVGQARIMDGEPARFGSYRSIGIPRICRASNMPSYGSGRCDQRHWLLLDDPCIFRTRAQDGRTRTHQAVKRETEGLGRAATVIKSPASYKEESGAKVRSRIWAPSRNPALDFENLNDPANPHLGVSRLT